MPARAKETRDAVAETTSVGAARAAAGEPKVSRAPGGDALLQEARKAGLLPLLVLHLLADGPSYGNQLIDRVGGMTAGALAVNPNTMYPLLRSLEAKGLIMGAWEHPERRSRRFYSVTHLGLEERDRLLEAVAPRLERAAQGIATIRRELGV